MGIDRRDFIKLAGLSTLLGLGGKSAFELLQPGQVEAAMEEAGEQAPGGCLVGTHDEAHA